MFHRRQPDQPPETFDKHKTGSPEQELAAAEGVTAHRTSGWLQRASSWIHEPACQEVPVRSSPPIKQAARNAEIAARYAQGEAADLAREFHVGRDRVYQLATRAGCGRAKSVEGLVARSCRRRL
jgi:hypothetical protein